MNQDNKIRVLIVDDHYVVRRGLKTFLTIFDDLEMVAEAEDGIQALARCQQYQPDVVLMDLEMPRMDGVEATRQIRERFPHINVIALTSFKDEERVQEAIKAGAIGYLLKDIGAQELVQAIRAAQAGKPTLAPEAAQVLIEASRRPSDADQELTEREQKVLALLIDGLSNRQIAEHLSFSISTIKGDIRSIFQKLEVDNRTEAVAKALQDKLV